MNRTSVDHRLGHVSGLNELTDCIDAYIMTLLKMHEESISMPKIGLIPRFPSLTKQPGTNCISPYRHEIRARIDG